MVVLGGRRFPMSETPGAIDLYMAPYSERLVFLLLDNQRQHHTFHIQRDVTPYAMC